MRRAMILLVAVVLLLVIFAPAASAHFVGPCNDTDGDGSPSGLEYATHHIKAGAQDGIIGRAHKPGSHKGFSVCIG